MLTAQADQPSALSGSVAHPFLSTRAASPLNGLHGSRAVLLADRLHRTPLQVMAHRIRPSTGHEVPRAARVSPKRSRQGTVTLIGSGRDKTHEGGSHEGL